LFAPPKPIETRVFASLPDKFKAVPVDNEFVLNQPGAKPHTIIEGPSFDKDGNLYIVEITLGRIFRIDAKQDVHLVAEYDGWPNGLKIARDGRIFIADYKNGLMLLDPVNGKVSPYCVRAGIERFKAINDLFIAANDVIYFTDQGLTGQHDPTGRLFRLGADGKVTCLVDNLPSPNGVVMNLDECTIYVAVTRANAVWRVPLMRDGSAAKVGTFIQMSGGGGPDGLALDEAGRLAVAHVGLGSVWVFDALGEPVYRVRSCKGLLTTNIAFGGPDRKSLFITESESATVLRAELDVPGKKMASGC
jgi:gluconolactonase